MMEEHPRDAEIVPTDFHNGVEHPNLPGFSVDGDNPKHRKTPEGNDDDDGGAHNRSHESIASRRTIIEADDFASFLAQEDEEDDLDDFKDEDVDFDVGDGEDGALDYERLTRGGSNPYMLDFTVGAAGDSEFEGGDYGDDDDTLSDQEGEGPPSLHHTPRAGGGGQSPIGGQHYDPERGSDPYYRQTRSWVKQAQNFYNQQTEIERTADAGHSDSEEFDSPPRNLREEINNNVSKYFPMGAPLGTSIGSSVSDEEVVTNSKVGIPGLAKYFIATGEEYAATIPPAPSFDSFKASKSKSGPQLTSQRQQRSTTQHHSKQIDQDFRPASQSSPIQHRKSQGDPYQDRRDSSLVKSRHPYQQYAANEVSTPYGRRPHNEYMAATLPAYPGGRTPSSYLMQSSGKSPPYRTSSMENLSSSSLITHYADDPQTFESYPQEDFTFDRLPLQRGSSLPDISGICPNCAFARSDYLFKIQLLQSQLEKTEKDIKKKEKQYAADIGELKKENDRQQKIISQSLNLGPEAKIEATMQHEITRLTSENLDLRESMDKQSDQIRKLKKMLKVYAKKLKDGEGWPDKWNWVRPSMSVSSDLAAEIAAEIENEENTTSTDAIATVIHRERSYMGMLEFKKEDEGALIKNLIQDLKPKLASGLIPGLPAYILFMCVRHTDYVNDDEKVKSLLTATINGIKKVVKRHSDDLERITLWLANTCRLLHTLKQYSGEKQFQNENTPKQNEQSLRNFDLSEYRQVFSDLAVWNYQALMKLMEELIQPNIVPAILEHEAIAGLTASKPSGLRGRSSSNARELEDGKDSQHALDALMRTLNSYMRIVKQHAVDPELVKQIFRQLFYFLCAGALNNLLLRKDMCNWSKGMQIRYNLSHLEQWLRDNNLHEFGAQAALEPIIQASQLLQARKTDSDVDSVCDMCSKLTTAQIVKILNIYTPVDEFEERVPVAFIRKIQSKLKEREEQGTASNTLLLDTKYSYPVTFPFNPSSVALETITVPEQLHLGFLIKH
nr:unconventional myosin-Va-like [Biomphalaria glabrata]